MSLTWPAALWLFLLLAVCVAQLEPVGCRSYRPAQVNLKGTLSRKTFAGPPNYQDIRKGDKAETYWLLNLDSPICVNQDDPAPDVNPGRKGVRNVQLVIRTEDYARFTPIVGKRVVATGSLIGEITGHHYTPVLLSVTSLEEPHWR